MCLSFGRAAHAQRFTRLTASIRRRTARVTRERAVNPPRTTRVVAHGPSASGAMSGAASPVATGATGFLSGTPWFAR